MKTKKIIEVIEFIRNYCKKRCKCDTCSFGKEGFCVFETIEYQHIPYTWDIETIKYNLKDIETL